MAIDVISPPAPPRPPAPPESPVPAADVPRDLQLRTVDDVGSLLGAGAASLGLVWVLYERVFAFSGVVGFVVCWYFAFLATYAAVTAVANPRAEVVDRICAAVVRGGAALVGLALTSTVVFVFVKGWPALHHWNFYTQDMAGVRPTAPLTQGGILHAIAGTVIQVGIASLIAVPLGTITAIYMTEVGGRLATTVRTVVEAMTALPDVLAGLFVYTILIIGFQWERDGLAASIALAVTMIPIIARSAEVVLKLVPSSLREASWALGVSQAQTVRRVVLPTAKTGMGTTLILGIARVAGETAPLLIVSGASTFLNLNPTHNPMNSLPLFIFTAVRSGEPLFVSRGYGAAALLMILVLFLFVLTRIVARDGSVKR